MKTAPVPNLVPSAVPGPVPSPVPCAVFSPAPGPLPSPGSAPVAAPVPALAWACRTAPRAAWRRLAAPLLALPLAACALNGAADERDFGATVRVALAQQQVNPAAAANRNPVAGLDGRSARSAIDNYDRSYATPAQPANAFKIGVGDGK